MAEKEIKNNLVLELHVPDLGLARKFYSKLGFEVIDETPVGQDLGYLVIKRKDSLGSTLINFYGGDSRIYNHDFFKDFSKGTKRGYEVEITVPVSDVESFYESVLPEIKENIVQELKMKRWGKKDFRITDPFGFYIRFTELINWGQ